MLINNENNKNNINYNALNKKSSISNSNNSHINYNNINNCNEDADHRNNNSKNSIIFNNLSSINCNKNSTDLMKHKNINKRITVINGNKELIKEFKHEIALILNLNLNLSNETDDNTDYKISYYHYIKSIVLFCYNKEANSKMNLEIERVKKLLDIVTFKHFLMEAYYLHYCNNK